MEEGGSPGSVTSLPLLWIILCWRCPDRSYVSSALTDEDEELCAWPDNMADIQILSFIETLRLNGTVDIVYTMAVDKNKPGEREDVSFGLIFRESSSSYCH